ncbi:MAG: aspartate kinase [Bacteroidales bacterium]|nr:aspartate kinase [Bacteroidales bacterium]
MVIYKFGGASVKDAEGVKNHRNILISHKEGRVIVISAFGKTTNKLEEITDAIYKKDQVRFNDRFRELKNYHHSIIKELFKGHEAVYEEVEYIFNAINRAFPEPWKHYDHLYDQIVSLGEILSTKIICAYLKHQHLNCQWIDIRENLITDDVYREASVDWESSQNRVSRNLVPTGSEILITQGFIGGTYDGVSTTLGREGSDYSAAILANILEAEKMIIWKDVPGVMNADPRYFQDASKLEKISFQEAIELAYYGAKILHPKTIKPLQNKKIPLYVKSFLEPGNKGTLIGEYNRYDEDKPIYILKKDQILISVLPRDFSFVFEETLSKIYSLFAKYRIKINLMQHSAINFTFCADMKNPYVFQLIEDLKEDYKVLYNTGLELLTIRHYTEQIIREVLKDRHILVEQRSRNTAQFLMEVQY